MKTRVFALLSLASLTAVIFCARTAAAKRYIAYISGSSNSSVVYWIAKEAGILQRNTASISIRSLSTAACAAFRA